MNQQREQGQGHQQSNVELDELRLALDDIIHFLTLANKRLAQAVTIPVTLSDGIIDKLQTIIGLKMALDPRIVDLTKRFDNATTAIAARIKTLTDQIGTGMSQEDVDTLVAQLTEEATKLEGLGADPNQPIPGETVPQ
jgi:hypothetical protein